MNSYSHKSVNAINGKIRYRESVPFIYFRSLHKEELLIEMNHGIVNASHAQIVQNR